MENSYHPPHSGCFLRAILLTLAFCAINPGFGQAGTTLDFDGVDDYVSIPSSGSHTTSSFTVEFWVKADDTPSSYDGVVDKGRSSSRNWYFLTNSGSLEIIFGLGHTSGLSEIYIPLGDLQWHHIAGTYDGTTMTAYLDGVEVGSQSASMTTDASRAIRLGEWLSGVNPFNGHLDELRIWDAARDSSEIRSHMFMSLTGSESGLVGYWNFDDGSGSTLDDATSAGNDGSLNDSPNWKTSSAYAGPRMALDFDGTDDHLSVPDDADLDLTNDFTIEAWVNFDNLSSTYSRIADKGIGYGFGIRDDRLRFSAYGRQNYDFLYEVPTGEWVHVAAVMDGSNDVTFYVNGSSVGTISGTYPCMTNSTALYLGSSSYGLSEFVDGKMDEIRIWADERSEAEIKDYMYRTLDGDESDLVAYFRLDQQSATGQETAYDYSGNEHHGTLANMSATTDWVSSSAFTTWMGAEDGDWSNANNWAGYSVPTDGNVGFYAWSGGNLPSSGDLSLNDCYIGSGVSISHSGNLTVKGDFINQGTFVSTGELNLSGSATQSIQGDGSSTIGTLTLNNVWGALIDQDLTVSDDLDLSLGDFFLGAITLTLNGSITKSSGGLYGSSSSSLTFGGSGASTGLPAVSLNNLTLNRANGITLTDDVTVEGTLTLTSGELNLNGNTLTIGNSGSIGGSPGTSNHVIATSGTLRKEYSGTGSFDFPVGDGTYYSPMTLNFTSGTFASAEVDVSVTDSKHPQNTSASEYITRYWTVNSSGISDFSCAVVATYADDDIVGTEIELAGAKWDGLTWLLLNNVTTATNQITGTVSGFSDFTAGEDAALPVDWVSFEAMVIGPRVKLAWETSAESNSSHFGVERKSNNGTWMELDQVPAAGFSDSPRDYLYVDLPGIEGKWIYRLRQVDLNGVYSFSAPVEVHMEAISLRTEANIFPNPVQNRLQVEAIGEWNLQLADPSGRVIQAHEGSGNQELDLSNLAPGLYLLHIMTEEGSRVEKLRKE